MSKIVDEYINGLISHRTMYMDTSFMSSSVLSSCTSSAVGWQRFPFWPTEQTRNRKLLLLKRTT